MRRLSFSANRSLTSKLVIAVSGFFLLGSLLFWYLIFQKEQIHLLNSSINFVASTSEVVKQSLRHDMLHGNMDDIQLNLEAIGQSELVESVKILSPDGRISYSSNTAEIGATKSLGAKPCSACHLAGTTTGRGRLPTIPHCVIRQEGEHRVLTYVEPIANQLDCYTAACHVHTESQDYLGLLMTDFSLTGIDTLISEQKRNSTIYLVIFVALLCLILSFILWLLVIRPVTLLSRGMEAVSGGDLSHKVEVKSEDELGRLADDFNTMTGELLESRQKMEQWTESLEQEVERKTEQIRKAQEKLIEAEKLAALGRMTMDIAHEIRNPLTALGGFGRRLLKDPPTEKVASYAAVIVSEADRLERILRDVLTFSRESRANLERLAVDEVVSESIHLYKEICDEQRIKVVFSALTNLPVLIDPDQMREAVNNLLANAIDAMEGGGTLSVLIEEVRRNELPYVMIEIADTGPGIPEDQLGLIYEPFYSTKKIGQGTGLGLSITRKIIEEHGGFIMAANRGEGGLRVCLHLPYQDPADEQSPCWEVMNCGRNVNNEMRCPAFPSFGRACWAVAGTMCEGKVLGTFAQKLSDCHRCEFFKTTVGRPT